MIQKILKTDVMVYNTTKNPKIYIEFPQLQSLKINNGGIENQQISKITNVEKHRNIRKWKAIEFFPKYQRI